MADRWNYSKVPKRYIPVKVYVDGSKFCAVHTNFINLQESPAGFGDTVEEAVNDLDNPNFKKS
jgi:hypothetical protein